MNNVPAGQKKKTQVKSLSLALPWLSLDSVIALSSVTVLETVVALSSAVALEHVALLLFMTKSALGSCCPAKQYLSSC